MNPLCSLVGEDVPYRSNHSHEVSSQRLWEGPKKMAQRHDDFFLQAIITVTRKAAS